MPKRSPSYSSLLLKCDHKSFPICVLYLWHESQHPEKVHRRTKGHCIRVLKEREKKTLKADSWSAMLYETDLHLKGEMWKLIKGDITTLESEVQQGELSQTHHSHIYRFQQRETLSCIFGRKWHYHCQQEEEKFPLAWHQLGQWETVATQPVQKITILWTPSFLQLTFYL